MTETNIEPVSTVTGNANESTNSEDRLIADLTISIKEGQKEGARTSVILAIITAAILMLTGFLSIQGLCDDLSDLMKKLTEKCGWWSWPLGIAIPIAVCGLMFWLHEAAHYITWFIGLPSEQHGGLRMAIKKGFQPCTICSTGECSVKLMLAAQMMPLFAAGVIPFIIACAMGNHLLMLTVVCGVSLMGEDVHAAKRLFKYRNRPNIYCKDSEDRMGCKIYERVSR